MCVYCASAAAPIHFWKPELHAAEGQEALMGVDVVPVGGEVGFLLVFVPADPAADVRRTSTARRGCDIRR